MAGRKPRHPPLKADLRAAGRRLSAARRAIGRTSLDLSEAYHVGESTWRAWEIGQNPIDPYTMLRLYREYGIPLDFIFAGVMRDLPPKYEAQIRAFLKIDGMADPTSPPGAWDPQFPHQPQRAAEQTQPPIRPPPRRRPPGGGTLHEPDKPFEP